MSNCSVPTVTVKDKTGTVLVEIKGNKSQDLKEFSQTLKDVQKQVNTYLTNLIHNDAPGDSVNSDSDGSEDAEEEEDDDDDDNDQTAGSDDAGGPASKRKKC
ncbi:nucleolar complex protein 2 homolog [Schistocerca cancellata]|uniref:nucleolar complex protein 2 homolog n=1 Tax=Schistocerca cancellata TaxID=274614 RepID=UPI002119081B|nr:nucleolar complex protein 2 homolog [Schistocerca cancellata]